MNDRTDLFRAQAIQALNEPQHGRPVLFYPRAWKYLGIFLGLLFGAMFVLAGVTSFHRTTSLNGLLLPVSGAVEVASDRVGRVEKLTVGYGDEVIAGQVVAVLDTDTMGEDGRSHSRVQVEVLKAELDELLNQETLLVAKRSAERRSHDLQQQSLVSEQRALRQQERQQLRRLGLARDKLARLERASTAIPEWQRLEQREQIAAQQQSLATMQGQLSATSVRMQQLAAERSRLDIEADLQMSVLQERQQRLHTEILSATAAATRSFVAPQNGVVADVTVHEGDTLVPGQSLMTILGDGAGLRAELFVPSRAIPHLRIGQLVQVAVDAFPRERHGTVDAVVEQVADTAMYPRDLPPQAAFNGSAYRVIARIETDRFALKSGMTVRAELQLEERTALEWLLEPLRSRDQG